MLDFGLRDKVALVAGAGLGIGEATALALAEAGCKVACLDLLPERAIQVSQRLRDLGVASLPITADVRNRDHVNSAIHQVVREFGRLDVVADVVGQARWGSILEVDDTDWSWAFDMCVRHQYLLAQCAGPQIASQGNGGAFVFVSSISGMFAAEGHGAYGAAKAAMISLTKTLAVEFAPDRIRVNSVAPAGISTPRGREWRAKNDTRHPTLVDRTPLRRRASVEEVATVMVFLLSDLASWVTGQTIVADGGVSTRFPSFA